MTDRNFFWICDDCGETREPCSCSIDDSRGVHGQDDYYDYYDGQPDEAQEWYDFDPDC